MRTTGPLALFVFIKQKEESHSEIQVGPIRGVRDIGSYEGGFFGVVSVPYNRSFLIPRFSLSTLLYSSFQVSGSYR